MAEEYNLNVQFIILTAVFLVCATWVLKKLKELYISLKAAQYLKRVIPHRPANWLTGHLLQGAFKPGLDWLRECTAEFPRGFLLSIGPLKDMNIFIINNPDHAQQLFGSLEGSTIKAAPYMYTRPVLGDGLFLTYGDEWSSHRKMLTSCFHFNILKNHMPVMNQVADNLIKDLHEIYAKKENFYSLRTVAVHTMDSLLLTTFSTDYNCKEHIANISHVVEGLTEIVQKRWILPWYSNDFIFNRTSLGKKFKEGAEFIDSIPNKILAERKERIKTSKSKDDPDFLEIMLNAKDENGKGLREQQIIDEIKSFLVAGHETTAKALTITLYALARHREHQDLVVEEINEILKGKDSDHVSWDDLNKLTYTTMCIKEAFRRYHSGTAGRTLTKPFKFDDMELPVGTQVWWLSYTIYHNPNVYGEDHMEYKPSRFSKENENKMHPFQFTPFAAGQRNCIGKNYAMNELKVFIARMVREYEFEILNDPKQSLNVKKSGRSGLHLPHNPKKEKLTLNGTSKN